MNFILKHFFNFLFPDICFYCKRKLLPTEEVLCIVCKYSAPFTEQVYISNNMKKKVFGLLPIENAYSFLVFEQKNVCQSLIHLLKYKNNKTAGYFLGKWMALYLKEIGTKIEADFIVPMPIHPKKEKERGYNQAEIIAKGFSDITKIPLKLNLILKTKYTKTQTKLDKEERAKNIRNTFELNKSMFEYNKHYLLFDDVITTGVTIIEAGKQLFIDKNTKVSIACIGYKE